MKNDKHFIYFHAPPNVAEAAGATFIKSKGIYRLPKNLHAARELYKLTAAPELIPLGQQLKAEYDHIKELKQLSDYEGLQILRPYQRADLHQLQEIENPAIFNEQRTGKTPTTIKLFEALTIQHILIVCPASLKENWKTELERFSSYKILLVEGHKPQRQKIYKSFTQLKAPAALIISYETMRNDLIELLQVKFDCIAADEAHRLRNYQSKQSKALYKLGRLVKKRIALTGTPAANHAADVFGIFHFLEPQKFPSYWQFVERYFNVKDSFFGKEPAGVKRADELQEIMNRYSIQRKRKDVMKWIPDIHRQKILVKPDKKQRRAYDEMLQNFEVTPNGKATERPILDAPSVLAQLTRLRQINLDPQLVGINAPSCKEKFLLDWLEDNKGTPVIIFSSFTSYLKKLQVTLNGKATGAIYGDMTATEKQKSVNEFQAGKTNILLANIISGSTGFTIDRAEVIIFLDRDYSPINNQQAEDRFIPTKENDGKKRTIIDILVKHSIDEVILQALEKKEDIIKYINKYGIN